MSWSSLITLLRKPLSGAKVSAEERKKFRLLQKKIGFKFRDASLLRRALIHKSYANEQRLNALEQNERYEFLGDAVLELAISHLMMELFPDFSEGSLSKLRAAVVNETSLAELARAIQLGDYLYLGKGEDQCQGREKDSLLSDAYEAVLGAIYLDSGFFAAYRVVETQFRGLMEKASQQDITRDYKTKLQEESQEQFHAIPRYQIVSEAGPDHDKTFEINLFIQGEIYGQGKGKSKKEAEQNAARQALDKLDKKAGRA
ncbi:MAG: ribonuclease III [Deltaproteobacteria bacterium]|nr:ribonuclease III [Deltaproteobacteria bacterium]